MIRDKLQQLEVGDTHEIKSDMLHFTAFFWVERAETDDLIELEQVVSVSGPQIGA